jgi:hypothetical protein
MMTVPRSVSEALRARGAVDLQDVLQLESLFGCCQVATVFVM